MFEKIDKFANKISQAALMVITVLGLAMLFITIASVIYRYVLHSSLTWGEEVLKISLVWFGLLSVGVIAYRREHVGITIFKEHMPKKVQRIFEFVSQILLLVASVAMFLIGCALVAKSGHQLTPALRIPYAYGYAAIPASFAVMIIYEIRNTMYEIDRLKKRDSEE